MFTWYVPLLSLVCGVFSVPIQFTVQRNAFSNDEGLILGPISNITEENIVANSIDPTVVGAENISLVAIINQTLTHLPRGAIRNLPNLQGILLHSTSIPKIEEEAFLNLPKLKQAGVILNKGMDIFPKNVLTHLPLKECTIVLNKLRNIEPGAFGRVEYLNLQDNELEGWNPDWFALEKPNLQNVILTGNKIGKIRDGAFRKFEKLTELKLGGNPLSEVEDEAFEGHLNLNVLDLSASRVKKLPASIVQAFNSSRPTKVVFQEPNSLYKEQKTTNFIILTGTPFNCSNLQEIQENAVKEKISFIYSKEECQTLGKHN